MAELTLQNILDNIDGINKPDADKEVTIEHTRIGADFTFLVPQLHELSGVNNQDGTMNIEAVYRVLSINLVTIINDDMLKALKVATQLDALKKLFTKNEVMIVMAKVMESMEDDGIVIKKQ